MFGRLPRIPPKVEGVCECKRTDDETQSKISKILGSKMQCMKCGKKIIVKPKEEPK